MKNIIYVPAFLFTLFLVVGLLIFYIPDHTSNDQPIPESYFPNVIFDLDFYQNPHKIDLQIYHSLTQNYTNYEYFPKILHSQVIINQTNPFELPVNPILPSNNNVAINFCHNRYYLAWRTSLFHFATNTTRIHIVSRTDLNFESNDWDFEKTIYIASDIREPDFICVNNTVKFSYFMSSDSINEFTPKGLFQIEKVSQNVQNTGPDFWSEPVQIGLPDEVIWQYVYENGTYYYTSYSGGEFSFKFKQDQINYLNWTIIDTENFTQSQQPNHTFYAEKYQQDHSVYEGGINEMAINFDLFA